MIVRWVAIGAVAISVAVGALAAQQRRGGPPGVFISKVPSHALSVVESDPTASGVTLSLLAPEDLRVSIQASPARDVQTLELKANVPSSIRLLGPAGGREGSYTITYPGGQLSGRITKPKPAGKEFTFVVQADSHLDQNTTAEMYTRTLGNMVADRPDFLIDLGDTFMNDKHADYHEAIKQYQAQHYYLGLVGASAPVFLALGNHDGEQGWNDRNRVGMSEWSRATRKSFFPPVQTSKEATGDTTSANYFEFRWGDAQCFVLDPFSATKRKPGSEGNNWAWTLGETQYRWLKSALERSTAKYRFVVIHHLVGGTGRDTRGGAEASAFFEWGGKNLDGTPGFVINRPGWDLPLHDLFVKHHVDVVFHGHDHLFARQDRDGVIYQLVPQPSHGRGDSIRSAEEYGYRSGVILSSSGYLRVKVAPGEAKLEYVKTSLEAPGSSIAHSYSLKP